jgi:hypothetical protein
LFEGPQAPPGAATLVVAATTAQHSTHLSLDPAEIFSVAAVQRWKGGMQHSTAQHHQAACATTLIEP